MKTPCWFDSLLGICKWHEIQLQVSILGRYGFIPTNQCNAINYYLRPVSSKLLSSRLLFLPCPAVHFYELMAESCCKELPPTKSIKSRKAREGRPACWNGNTRILHGGRVYSIVQTEAHLSTGQLLLHCCVTLHKSGPCYADSFSKDMDNVRFFNPFNDPPIVQ